MKRTKTIKIEVYESPSLTKIIKIFNDVNTFIDWINIDKPYNFDVCADQVAVNNQIFLDWEEFDYYINNNIIW